MTLTHALTYFLVIVTCVIIASIIFNRTTFEMGTKLDIFSFRRLIGSYLVFAVSDGICLWADYAKDPGIGNILALVSFLALCGCAFFWFRFVESRLGIAEHSRTVNILIFTPLLVLIILVSTSIFTKLIFFYESDGTFYRGPLYSSLVWFQIFYIVYASHHIAVRYITNHSPHDRKELLYLSSFLFLPLIARGIDLISPGLPIMALALLICIVIVYVSLQDRLIYVDSLTGMSNRRVADKYLSSQLEIVGKDNPLYFFLADCDDFKNINDKFGHLEGDKALCIIASELEKISLMYNCHVSRWGGDEFVIIARSISVPNPDELIDKFLDNLKQRCIDENLPYEIQISVGYISCDNPDTSTIELFGIAERLMYKKKAERKRNMSRLD